MPEWLIVFAGFGILTCIFFFGTLAWEFIVAPILMAFLNWRRQ